MEQGEGLKPPKKWFELTVSSAHAKKGETHKNYVYAVEPDLAFRQALSMGGWRKRDPYKIRPLNEDETEILEEIISKLPGVNLEQAENLGLHGKRKDLDKSVAEILIEKLEEKHKKE